MNVVRHSADRKQRAAFAPHDSADVLIKSRLKFRLDHGGALSRRKDNVQQNLRVCSRHHAYDAPSGAVLEKVVANHGFGVAPAAPSDRLTRGNIPWPRPGQCTLSGMYISTS